MIFSNRNYCHLLFFATPVVEFIIRYSHLHPRACTTREKVKTKLDFVVDLYPLHHGISPDGNGRAGLRAPDEVAGGTVPPDPPVPRLRRGSQGPYPPVPAAQLMWYLGDHLVPHFRPSPATEITQSGPGSTPS